VLLVVVVVVEREEKKKKKKRDRGCYICILASTLSGQAQQFEEKEQRDGMDKRVAENELS